MHGDFGKEQRVNYFIQRETQEYGPYSLAELQKYVASGNIALTDLCRSEAMTEWVPVSQVIGNIPVPVATTVPASGAGSAYGAAPVFSYPEPPTLHWGIALTLHLVTCGLFGWVWIIVQSVWMKKVQPNSRAIYWYGAALALWILTFFAGFVIGFTLRTSRINIHEAILVVRLVQLGVWILAMIGNFSMKNSLEEHYNTNEPIGLQLSGVITFVLSIIMMGYIYFQYHFTQINAMRERQMTGYAR